MPALFTWQCSAKKSSFAMKDGIRGSFPLTPPERKVFPFEAAAGFGFVSLVNSAPLCALEETWRPLMIQGEEPFCGGEGRARRRRRPPAPVYVSCARGRSRSLLAWIRKRGRQRRTDGRTDGHRTGDVSAPSPLVFGLVRRERKE